MKRFNRAALLVAAVILCATGRAQGDQLVPIDPTGPFADAKGIVKTNYKFMWQVDSWGNRYKVQYYDHNYQFSGLVADPVNGTSYILYGYFSNGSKIPRAYIGTLDGTAKDDGDWFDGCYQGTFVYYELWTAYIWQDDIGLYMWEPIEAVLASR